MRAKITGILAVSIALWAPVQQAATLERAEVDRFVKPLTDGGWCQSVVIGLIGPDGADVFGYGLTGADGEAPDGDTVYEIGSATKGFTGLLLADMVTRGEVALADPVQQFLPDTVKLAQQGDKPLTLEDLATHRSGLPRLPDNLKPKDPTNPYADYTVDQMYDFLGRWKPTRQPGEGYEYSNLGAGLLGHLLARKAGKDYEALLAERVLRPLGMGDTSIKLSDGQRKRLAPPHDADGEPNHNWDLPTLAGAGALRSTGNDLVKFLRANLVKADTPLSKAMALSHEARARVDEANDIGLGWHVNRGSKIVWHNGQTGGYHSYVGFVPGKVGVVVLSNTATGVVDEAGAALVRRMLGEPAEPPKVKPTVKLEAAALEPLVGDFPLAPQFVISITREGDRLYLQATGQPRFRLHASAEREFYLRVVDARVTFDQPVDGKSPRLVLHQNGLAMPGPRKP